MADEVKPEAGGPDTSGAVSATAQSRGGGPPSDAPPDPSNDRVADGSRRRARAAPRRFRLGNRVTAAAAAARYERALDDPIYRPLKIYTIDPSGRRLEGQTAEINVPFETVKCGPIGARFEVVGVKGGPLGDYPAVDLNEPRLLIANGHDPAPTDPVFHHQMLYAVAMNTYAVFRTALGRELSWAFPGRRLKLVPHALEGANARYVRKRGVLEFGWYRVKLEDAGELPPNGLVYACLSHDVIAHELTHALLDGLRVRFDKDTNPDVPAFHEAFADLVALFQRFSYKEVVRSNIVRTSGDLAHEDGDLLGFVFELARGQGQRSLRAVDLKAKKRYDENLDEYELGTVLVSAVIEAFLTIYRRRAAPLIRMATSGRKAVTDGDSMSEDLLDALSHLASRLASQILSMCVRAIDYCPPVDIRLGEYLRALITADRDLVPDDPYAYREALIDAFRRRRIYPPDVSALTEDALLWRRPKTALAQRGLDFGALHFDRGLGTPSSAEELERRADLVGELVCDHLDQFGLAAPTDPELGGDKVDPPVVESVRTVGRVGPDGQLAYDLVAEVSQRRLVAGGPKRGGFDFYGGATIIFDSLGRVRLVVRKDVKSSDRLERQRKYAMRNYVDIDGHALDRCRYGMPASADRATARSADLIAAE